MFFRRKRNKSLILGHTQNLCIMKLYISLLFIVQLFSTVVFCQQDNDYRDLLILYADGDYSNCLKKAKKYMKKSKCANDEFPYLVSSAAYFSISKDQLYDLDYPNAYYYAFEFAGVAYQKMKETSSYVDFKNSFLPDLVMSAIEDARYAMIDADSTTLKEVIIRMDQLNQFNPVDPGFLLIKSAYQNHLKDSVGANETYKKGMALMNGLSSTKNMPETGRVSLKLGLLLCADYYAWNRPEKARSILIEGKFLFAGDEEYEYALNNLN